VTKKPMKILIVKLGALGDVINTFPLAIILKEKLQCEIHWLVAPLSYPMVADHDCVDRAILFDKTKGLSSVKEVLKQIRVQEPYDIAFDLQRILKSGFFVLASKSRRKIGFDKNRCKELSWFFPFERIPPLDPQSHMLDQYLEFTDYLQIQYDNIQWKIPKKDISMPVLPEQYLVLNIGATKPVNQWNPNNFATLIDEVAKKIKIPCVLTGGPEDKATAEIIKTKASGSVIDLCGKTTLYELIHILSNAFGTISCDTGPMHLSIALNTRVIALFGPSNPERTGPYNGIVIKKELDCSPCNKKQCPNPSCMDKISVDDVMHQLQKWIV
jgi:heptosyltransferase-1